MDNTLTAPPRSADASRADEDLMLAYAAGDTAAFDLLYDRHRGAVYRYFLRQLPQDQANDCFQALWLKLIKARTRYQADAPLVNFLFTLAHNVLMDHYRRNRRLVAVEDENLEMLANEELDDKEMDTVSRTAEKDQLLEKLRSLTSQLPFHQRQAWLMQQEANLSHEEIATITNTSGEGVKSRLRYARAKLKAGLKAYVR